MLEDPQPFVARFSTTPFRPESEFSLGVIQFLAGPILNCLLPLSPGSIRFLASDLNVGQLACDSRFPTKATLTHRFMQTHVCSHIHTYMDTLIHRCIGTWIHRYIDT